MPYEHEPHFDSHSPIRSMETQSRVSDITFGTGYNIFKETVLPAVEAATQSVTLVTCFWAASRTRDALNESLLVLNDNALRRGSKVTVRICFSSSSLFQKVFHTSSPEGKTYPPAICHSKLGLPEQHNLQGLDLEVKSIFFLPFSVWHPKFVIIDDNEVFLPSCNVSWEDWFEGCVRLNGAIVQHFIDFWKSHWASASDRGNVSLSASTMSQTPSTTSFDHVVCRFLPSPHHRNPNFQLPWQPCAPPPQTPLNMETLKIFASADKEIRIQTPNLTCAAVIDALVDALNRGVNVRVLTSERLMILEQLVTAGTTTSMCVKHLISKHQEMMKVPRDVEVGYHQLGRLEISYYEPRADAGRETDEPVQSHLKLTVVDESILVLGSGNMDRASWYTSQELGVAFYSTELSLEISRLLTVELKGRTKLVYDSSKA